MQLLDTAHGVILSHRTIILILRFHIIYKYLTLLYITYLF